MDPINSENYNLQKGYGLEKNKERDFIELCASPYEYAYDNPINYNDETGEQPNKDKYENNPPKTTFKEDAAMGTVSAIKDGAVRHDFKVNKYNSGYWGDGSDKLDGRYMCGPGCYVTDTHQESAEQLNLYVYTGAMFYVDEHQAENLSDYESFVVKIILKNFESGDGAQNYYFPENGIISSKFLNSDILDRSLKEFHSGKIANNESKQINFGLSDLGADYFRNSTIYSITGLTGSAQVTITKTNDGLKIKIFNITSLSSGAFIKNPNDPNSFPKSYVRNPFKKTPYGNISQTFNLFVPNNSPILKKYNKK